MMLRETGLKADEGHWQDHIHYYKYLAGKVDHYLLAQKKQEWLLATVKFISHDYCV